MPKKLQTLGLPNLILAVDHHHPFRSLATFGLSDAFAPLHHTLISKKTDSIMHNFADFSRFEVCIENGGIWKNNPYNHTTTKWLVICQFQKNDHFVSVVISGIYKKRKIGKHFIYPFTAPPETA